MDWYPHYIDDYSADTLGLSLAEDGAYRRLLDWYYKNERPIPGDEKSLAAISRVTLEEWREVSRVTQFFVTRDTKVGHELVHKRCNAVILAQSKKRKDWKSRQERHRKNGIEKHVTREARVSHASRGEESSKMLSVKKGSSREVKQDTQGVVVSTVARLAGETDFPTLPAFLDRRNSIKQVAK
jgi:uncharacterized protein YdaU (DUF1376 family)